MNKQEFLSALESAMGQFSKTTVDETLHYYQELIEDRIEDGMSEEDAVAQMDSIEGIISTMSTELPMSTIVKNKIDTIKTKDSGNKTLWIVLAICGFPVWLPVGLSILAVVFAIYVTIWSLIASFYAVLASFAGATVMGIISGFVHFFNAEPGIGFANIGFSILFAGFFLLLITPLNYLAKQLVALTKQFGRWIKKIIIGKKGGTTSNE